MNQQLSESATILGDKERARIQRSVFVACSVVSRPLKRMGGLGEKETVGGERNVRWETDVAPVVFFIPMRFLVNLPPSEFRLRCNVWPQPASAHRMWLTTCYIDPKWLN